MAVMQMNKEIDVRAILPAVRVPTLVLHREHDRTIRVEQARYLARHIPGSKLVELTGADHAPWVDDTDALVDEVEEFLTGVRHAPESDRIFIGSRPFTNSSDAAMSCVVPSLSRRTVAGPRETPSCRATAAAISPCVDDRSRRDAS